MKVVKFMAMFAAAVAVGASFADVDSYLYYMLDSGLTYSELAGSALKGQPVPVDEDSYAKVSTDGGQTYLTLYSAQGGSTGQDMLTYGNTGRVGFSSTPSFTSFLFEVYDGVTHDRLGWTTLAYDKASDFIYDTPTKSSATSVFHVTQLIPEPTSGLLLLLGAAGLALRRRRMARA